MMLSGHQPHGGMDAATRRPATSGEMTFLIMKQRGHETNVARMTYRCDVCPFGWHEKSVKVGVDVGLMIQTAVLVTINFFETM